MHAALKNQIDRIVVSPLLNDDIPAAESVYNARDVTIGYTLAESCDNLRKLLAGRGIGGY